MNCGYCGNDLSRDFKTQKIPDESVPTGCGVVEYDYHPTSTLFLM
jgi:hypothetical protein